MTDRDTDIRKLISEDARAPEDTARALGKYFSLDQATSLILYDEVARIAKKDMAELKKDSEKCSDAVTVDKRSISNIDALLKSPGDQGLLAQVKKDAQDDSSGDRDAVGDDHKHARRAAYIAALDQAVLDRGEFRGKPLTAEQKSMIANDRDNKIKDARNCFQDLPQESTYISDDQALLAALRDPTKFEQLKAASDKVKADRRNDLTLEGGPTVPAKDGGAVQAGTGFIGQNERSIDSDVQMAKTLRFKDSLE